MKRVRIYTLNGFFNYGNRLQLFALSTVLRRLNLDVSVYWPKTSKNKLKDTIKLSLLKKVYKKESKLSIFTKKYIPRISNKGNAYFSIVGSDQVWNPDYFKTRPYLLNTPDKGKKLSYAASIGFSELTNEQGESFKKALKNYSAISVREQSAKDLLGPLTNKKIEVVLDPTLLLDKSEYELLEKRPKNLNENEQYILCYILGNRDYEVAIEKIAKERSYKTIYFSDKRDSSYGVEEFLYLIHHAQLVCTDSFHACVFSFIFERPFVAFKRSGKANYMYTRLQNLIDTFKLKDREFNGEEITEANQKVNYTEAKKILKKEQEKSLNFIKKALEINDEK